MSLTKAPNWKKLSNDRQRELLPIIFKNTIRKPKVWLSYLVHFTVIIPILFYLPNFEYKTIALLIFVPIWIRISLRPLGNVQLEEFYKIEGIEDDPMSPVADLQNTNIEPSMPKDPMHPKIRQDRGKYAVQTRKYLVYYFKYFDDYDSALRFVEDNPDNSYQ